MNPRIIDTNILTHIQEGDDEAINRRIRTYQPGSIGITIISVEEALAGWYAGGTKNQRSWPPSIRSLRRP
jgi:predicted nucleic acid-binding protein